MHSLAMFALPATYNKHKTKSQSYHALLPLMLLLLLLLLIGFDGHLMPQTINRIHPAASRDR